jgi:hypothetical protein
VFEFEVVKLGKDVLAIGEVMIAVGVVVVGVVVVVVVGVVVVVVLVVVVVVGVVVVVVVNGINPGRFACAVQTPSTRSHPADMTGTAHVVCGSAGFTGNAEPLSWAQSDTRQFVQTHTSLCVAQVSAVADRALHWLRQLEVSVHVQFWEVQSAAVLNSTQLAESPPHTPS